MSEKRHRPACMCEICVGIINPNRARVLRKRAKEYFGYAREALERMRAVRHLRNAECSLDYSKWDAAETAFEGAHKIARESLRIVNTCRIEKGTTRYA